MTLSRYITFERFMDMCVTKTLSLPKSTLFDDPWEGMPKLCWDIIADQTDQVRYNEYVRQQKKLGNPSLSPKDIQKIDSLPKSDNVQKAKTWIYVSCWHTAPEESMAMWKLYAQEVNGVCIQVEDKKLEQVFSAAYKKRNDLIIIARDVTYIRPGERIDKIPQAKFFYLRKKSNYTGNFAHHAAVGGLHIKHKGHSFEEEFRVVCDTFWLSNSKELKPCDKEDYWKVEIPQDFFNKIILYPRAEESIIKSIDSLLKKYGFNNCSVERSSLDIEKYK